MSIERMNVLANRLKGLQTTHKEMMEQIEFLEQGIKDSYELEALMKESIVTLKDEVEMSKQELVMRKTVIKNLPILIAEIEEEYTLMVKAAVVHSAVQYIQGDFTEDDAILYDTWCERIAWAYYVSVLRNEKID